MLIVVILVAWTSVAVLLSMPVGRLCAIRSSASSARKV
jgi:hypothetical protein